jgi:hypothetical protein
VAQRNPNNELDLYVRSIDDSGNRSDFLHAGKLFDQAMQHFQAKGVELKAINGRWEYGTNLKIVNELTARGVPLEKAVLETWTAKQAARHGYTEAHVSWTVGEQGAYQVVRVQFVRPTVGPR